MTQKYKLISICANTPYIINDQSTTHSPDESVFYDDHIWPNCIFNFDKSCPLDLYNVLYTLGRDIVAHDALTMLEHKYPTGPDKITIKCSNRMTALGNFDPYTNTITILDIVSSDHIVALEEIVHALQYKQYPYNAIDEGLFELEAKIIILLYLDKNPQRTNRMDEYAWHHLEKFYRDQREENWDSAWEALEMMGYHFYKKPDWSKWNPEIFNILKLSR